MKEGKPGKGGVVTGNHGGAKPMGGQGAHIECRQVGGAGVRL